MLPGSELSRNSTPEWQLVPARTPVLLKWKHFLPVNLPEFSEESHFGFAPRRI